MYLGNLMQVLKIAARSLHNTEEPERPIFSTCNNAAVATLFVVKRHRDQVEILRLYYHTHLRRLTERYFIALILHAVSTADKVVHIAPNVVWLLPLFHYHSSFFYLSTTVSHPPKTLEADTERIEEHSNDKVDN